MTDTAILKALEEEHQRRLGTGYEGLLVCYFGNDREQLNSVDALISKLEDRFQKVKFLTPSPPSHVNLNSGIIYDRFKRIYLLDVLEDKINEGLVHGEMYVPDLPIVAVGAFGAYSLFSGTMPSGGHYMGLDYRLPALLTCFTSGFCQLLHALNIDPKSSNLIPKLLDKRDNMTGALSDNNVMWNANAGIYYSIFNSSRASMLLGYSKSDEEQICEDLSQTVLNYFIVHEYFHALHAEIGTSLGFSPLEEVTAVPGYSDDQNMEFEADTAGLRHLLLEVRRSGQDVETVLLFFVFSKICFLIAGSILRKNAESYKVRNSSDELKHPKWHDRITSLCAAYVGTIQYGTFQELDAPNSEKEKIVEVLEMMVGIGAFIERQFSSLKPDVVVKP